MFGGTTSCVATLNSIINSVDEQHPTTDELAGWHRGRFDRVSSQDSIMRHFEYLEDIGFLTAEIGVWTLGPKGKRYVADRSTETLLEIMCRRNAGLRSLLYALSVGAMSIEEIGRQQLEQPLLRLARHVIIYLMYYQDN